MPRNSRRDFPGLFHHIMSQGINKEYIFDNDKLKKMYIDLIKEKSEKNNVKLMAYCIMDNHVHMLINVDKIEEMCKFMQQINTAYAKFYNKQFDRVGYVFRNRYLSKTILDEGQLKRCIVYIHKNPVEAKIVEHERDYIFSSFNEYMKDDNKCKIICPDVEKFLFGDIPKEEFKYYFDMMHNYKNNEINEFDNFEVKEKMNLEEIKQKYFKLNDEEKIVRLSLDEKISERKLAESFNKTRYEVRKILERWKMNQNNNVPSGREEN